MIVAQAETELERQLSVLLMHGAHKPKIRSVATGEALAEQGEWSKELFLVLDGMLSVSVDGKALGVVGPGAVLGERAILENRRRTATLTALTPVRVAAAPADAIDREALASLARPAPARGGVRLTLLGVRGSTPAPGADFVRYGGHTSCVTVSVGDDRPTAGARGRHRTPVAVRRLGGHAVPG